MASHLLISEAADLLGLTTKALRHYEKIGLVTPIRSENGYRVYTADHILRLLRIQRLRSLGLSLTQIKTLLDEENDAQVWQTILHALLERVDTQIGVLEQRREEIEYLIANGSAEILAMPEELSTTLQRAEAYLDQNLFGAQASLWNQEKQLYHLASRPPHLAILSQWLVEPPINAYGRPYHAYGRLNVMSSLIKEEEDR